MTTSDHCEESAAPSWYGYFASQLSTLISGFGLRHESERVLGAFGIICGDCLRTPRDRPPPNFSRINFDGLPLQYSLALGAFEPTLQFIGEAGAAGSSAAARLKVNTETISRLVGLLGLDKLTFPLPELLREMVPESDPHLLCGHADTLWLSPSFSPSARPRLTVYINVRWGDEDGRRRRLARFASYLGDETLWGDFRDFTDGEMEPLGAAVTLAADSPPTGRVYVSAFGKSLEYYANLTRALTDTRFERLFRRFMKTMLSEDCQYPTRSVVCSVRIGPGGATDFKFELCGHCAFESDTQAKSRHMNWLSSIGVDAAPYLSLLDALAGGRLNATSAVAHAYTGVGLKAGMPYSTIYLKPDTARGADE